MATQTREEMNERMFRIIMKMDNKEIEFLYNKEFGDNLKYVGMVYSSG
jgi:tyrosyl-tRNA synthetase